MYREQTEPDAGRTGTKKNHPHTPAPARKGPPLRWRGLLAFGVMLAVAVGGYALMFAAFDFLVKG